MNKSEFEEKMQRYRSETPLNVRMVHGLIGIVHIICSWLIIINFSYIITDGFWNVLGAFVFSATIIAVSSGLGEKLYDNIMVGETLVSIIYSFMAFLVFMKYGFKVTPMVVVMISLYAIREITDIYLVNKMLKC